MKLPIYLDHQATTPLDPRVLEAMMPFFTSEFGNPASTTHAFGIYAESQVEAARLQIARLIGADPDEIVFTSGATESNNTALKGVFETYSDKGKHIITQATEHRSVLDSCRYLQSLGAKVTILPVDSSGRISLEDLERAITEETLLVSMMFANNEIGTVQPITEIGRIAKARNVFFHVDAAQAAGKFPIDVQKLGIDLLSFSGHKMYGPKGIGALYVRKVNPCVRPAPILHGGGHERGMRSGTLNVPAIIGLAKACEIAALEMDGEGARLRTLRDQLRQKIESRLEGVSLNGHPAERLPNNLNLSFSGVDGGALLKDLTRDIAVSSGSACATERPEPSHVLKALGFADERAYTSIRFGLGRFTTAEEMDYTANRVVETVTRLRSSNPIHKEKPDHSSSSS